ncbi:hypothetical protein OIU34_21860 [Pararhizobium sp. BT-229]|uniref:phage tail protein n=1 Tax=Pararhizobium sp. BT-229 TaxID=2986923 RepID=UPI0021F6BC68|nr:hypothetical protein [Pararhizobium sp. BT-229]MCV9964540.1 hypothetical protein [Pararhizobium sp. BT-229]
MRTGIYAAAVLALALTPQTSALAQAPQCTTVADCAQKAMEAAYQAKLALEIAVPKGAVMAFNLEQCPNGWSPFSAVSGRVIVGSGKAGTLSERKLGDQGGEEKHTLSIEEMPSHNHFNGVYQYLMSINGQITVGSIDSNPPWEPNLGSAAQMSAAGGGQAHNVMQPFHVLTYCERK